MGLLAFLDLEGPDIVAFFIASVVGYFAGAIAPAGWAIDVSVLLSYHLFLAWLIVSARQKTGASLPLAPTILTHLACLAVVVPLGMARSYIPFFGIFRYGIAALAIFERGWLFSGKTGEPKRGEVPTPAIVVASTGEDFQEWQRYLAQQKPGSRRMGTSLKAEYEQWLLARHQNRPTEPSTTPEGSTQ